MQARIGDGDSDAFLLSSIFQQRGAGNVQDTDTDNYYIYCRL